MQSRRGSSESLEWFGCDATEQRRSRRETHCHRLTRSLVLAPVACVLLPSRLALMEDDILSVFSYEEEEGSTPDKFSLTALTSEANRLFFPAKCSLTKIGEGGYHKVSLVSFCIKHFVSCYAQIYDVKGSDGEEFNAVARVASPAFPKDKLESEVSSFAIESATFCYRHFQGSDDEISCRKNIHTYPNRDILELRCFQ